MPMYRYVKASFHLKRPNKYARFFSFVFMSMGGLLLIWTIWPILLFTMIHSDVFTSIVAPVEERPKSTGTASSLSPVAFAADSEFTNANAWYPAAPQKHVVTPVNTYELSIPKLKINRAMVTVGGDDLGESLVHYGGTGLPGQFGTTVVFGHSTLPQFFNPKNYKSIFSLLPTLKVGDDILVYYDGVQYQYRIFEMVVLDPPDLSTLEQRFDDSYLTLVTCVPPGTYWKRLNVKAKLEALP